MAEQNLDSAQVGAGFKHVRRETVSKQMRRNVLIDAGALAGFFTASQTTFGVWVYLPASCLLPGNR